MTHENSPSILVAGMGSELQSDDAFGLVVVRRFRESGPPAGVEAMEAGTAGIGLVQQLMDGYQHLIIVDAVDRGHVAGSLYLLEPDIQPISDYSNQDQQALLTDMHYTVPSRVLTLSQALDILPESVLILGCQPSDLAVGLDLTETVASRVDDAVSMLHRVTRRLLDGKSVTANSDGLASET